MSDLVPVDTFALVPAASELAAQIAATDFAPVGLRGKPAAVMAAMLTGHELGIGPMASLSQIAVINGRPCMSAQLMRALVQRAGHELWFEAKGNTKVTVCGRRANWPEDRIAKVTWTMDDAKAAGLSGGQNYRKYPRAMLAARATGELCRDNFADVLGGIGYTPEELTDGDLIAGGDLVVDGRDDVAPASAPTSKRQAARPATAAKKATPKKAAAPPPAPVSSLPVPPLPGEPGYEAGADVEVPQGDGEDIVDAEIVTDDPPATLAASLEADGITQPKALRRARELAGDNGHPLPMSIDEITGDVLILLVDDLGIVAPADAAPKVDKRNAKMHAMAAEAWPDKSITQARRKALIGVVTNGRTDSSHDLDADEWSDLFDALQQVIDGTAELFLRGTGDWELRMGGAK